MKINQVTETPEVYEGESKNWFVRLQPLHGDDHLLYLSAKSLEDNKVLNISISGFKSNFSVESKLIGKSQYIYGDGLPENVTELEEINIDIKSNGKEDTLTLNRVTNVDITP